MSSIYWKFVFSSKLVCLFDWAAPDGENSSFRAALDLYREDKQFRIAYRWHLDVISSYEATPSTENFAYSTINVKLCKSSLTESI